MPKVEMQKAEVHPDYLLTQKLIGEFRQFWIEKLRESGAANVKFTRLSVVALTQVAAILAVDAGMQPEQFTAVCMANFKEAYARAPKFG